MERDYFKTSQATKDMINEIMESRFEGMRKAIQTNYDYLGSTVQEYIPLFKWGTLVRVDLTS